MTDRPIIFSAPMIRALLDGRKTQTRRIFTLPTKVNGHVIYEHPKMGGWEPTINGGGGVFKFGKSGERIPVPETIGIWHKTCGACLDARYQIGDRLYVREEWCSTPAYDDLKPSEMGGDEPVRFGADDATFNWAEADGGRKGRRRPGMHMPRWASRLTLIVEGVRVERLQDISEADAIAEGVTLIEEAQECPVGAYRDLWNSLHGPNAWDANPWVVAVAFRVIQQNIDSIEERAA